WVHGARVQTKFFGWAGRFFLGSLFISGFFLFFFVLNRQSLFGAILGSESRDHYLSRVFDYYGAASFVNARLPAGSNIFVLGDQRGYYYDVPVTVSTVFNQNPLVRWADEAGSPKALAERLKKEGFTHLVVNHTEMRRLDIYHVFDLTAAGERNLRGLESEPSRVLYRDAACEVLRL